jgi:hypothetical protein
MGWQLIYTSAPRGLLTGQSGFCTVARSSGLRDAVAQRLEQLSSYHHLEVSGASARNPTISAYRILDIRGTKYHVLTRIRPCGLDFTSRTNHLAHHLVFAAEELAQLPSPAVILREWPGWLNSWQGEPRELGLVPASSFGTLQSPGRSAQAWLRLTGDAGRAAGLLESQFARGCYLLCPPEGEQKLLELFGETLQLLNPRGLTAPRAWQHTFTTFLQGEDVPTDFLWRGCREGTPGAQYALRRAAPLIPLQSLPVSINSETRLVRADLRSRSATPLPKPPGQLRITRRAPGSGQPTAPSDGNWDPWSEPEPQEEPAPHSSRWPWVAMAIILLASVSLYYYFSRKQSPTPVQTADTNVVAAASDSATNQPAPSNTSVPAQGELDNSRLIQKQEDEEKRKRELDADLLMLNDLHWQDMPIYLVVASNPATIPIPLEVIEPLTNLLQKLDRLDLSCQQLDLRYHLFLWKLPEGNQMRPDCDLGQKRLHATTERGNDAIEFDYGDLKQQHLVKVRAVTDLRNIAIRFSTKNLTTTNAQIFAPFRLMVVYERDAPKPLRLSRNLLSPRGTRWSETLQPLLWERLKQFHFAGGVTNWQLRPFVGTNEASAKYLYKGWAPQDIPPPGSELNFAAIKEKLEAECNERSNKVANLDSEVAKLKSQVDELKKQTDSLTGQADEPASLEKQASDLEKRAQACQKESSGFENQAKLKTQTKDLNAAQDFEEKAKQKREEAQSLQKEAQGKREQAGKLRPEADEKREKANRLRGDAKKIVLQIEQLGATQQNEEKRFGILRMRLKEWPDNLERAAYVSLSAVGTNVEVEVIRFGDEPMGGKQ